MTPRAASGVLPNFLVIGAQRCATSWLYFCLKEHPGVYVPYIKEVSYFSDYYANGAEWYRRYFQAWDGQKAVGEITPAYLYREVAPLRIARDLPDAKLVVIFRNPIERAVSQYRKHVRSGNVAVDFETAIARDPEYLERGLYHRQIRRYLSSFPRERIHVMLYEDIEKDAKGELAKLFAFLGVDSSFTPPSAEKMIPADDLVSGLYKHATKTSQAARKAGLGFAVDLVKRSGLMPLADRLFQRFGPRVSRKRTAARPHGEGRISPATRAKLGSYFREENEKLADWLGRDLSFWK